MATKIDKLAQNMLTFSSGVEEQSSDTAGV